jgi:hypothetical protein
MATGASAVSGAGAGGAAVETPAANTQEAVNAAGSYDAAAESIRSRSTGLGSRGQAMRMELREWILVLAKKIRTTKRN